MVSARTNFSENKFRRSGGGVSFEERAVQPSDFTADRGYGDYALAYANSPTQFSMDYSNWQAFADCFIMRRAIISISGTQDCDTNSFKASDIENFTNPDFTKLAAFKLPGSLGNTVPGGKYQCTSFSFTDNGNGYTSVSVSYQQYQDWKLIKITQQSSLPNPKPKAV